MRINGKQVLLAFALTSLVGTIAQTRELGKKEWYVRLIVTAEAEGLRDRGNVLGQLDDALSGADQHDLRELVGAFSGPYLSVVFYRPEWNLEVQEYASDYHPVAKNKADEWAFEVRSNDPWRELTLTWEGQQAPLSNMVLVDVATGDVVPALVAGAAGQYSFNMAGEAVRAFQWQLLSPRDQGGKGKPSGKQQKSDWSPYGQARKDQGQLPSDPFSD